MAGGPILLSLVHPYLHWVSLPAPRGLESMRGKSTSYSIVDWNLIQRTDFGNVKAYNIVFLK